jgi:hypothetical protein
MGMDIYMVEVPAGLPPGYVPHDREQPDYYRFTTSSMAAMLALMEAARVIANDPVPACPRWPPEGVRDDRLPLIEASLSSERLDAALTQSERQTVLEAIVRNATLRSTRSHTAGKVPAFKFLSNDGWIVIPEECDAIAAALYRHAEHTSVHDLGLAEAAYQEKQRAVLLPRSVAGELVLLGDEPLGLSLAELRAWVREWAAYNELASRHGGYRVD